MDQPNTPTTTPLSETERFEYQQLSDWARHDDTMIYQTASTVLPLSFGAVAVAVQYPKMAIPLALFSLALYGYWLVVAIRLSWFSSVRIDRMRGLEMTSAMQHHTQLKVPPAHLEAQIGNRLSIRKFRTVGAFFWGSLVDYAILFASKFGQGRKIGLRRRGHGDGSYSSNFRASISGQKIRSIKEQIY